MSQYCDNFEFSENNQDHFEMMPDSGDTFQFWQGLQGPYFVPAIDQDGWLSWTNNGGLPNPTPVQIVGKDGRGITLTGYCETVADLPEDPEQGEAWAVGEEEPFECYAWFGGWVDMGLLFPPGPPGQDGVSPAVTITTTTTGHKVKITDKDHPAGQEFDVENGEDGDPGPGVPAGGSAGQYLKKASEADYDGEWDTINAGDVAYDDSLTYASGTVGEELSAQKNTLNSLCIKGSQSTISANGTTSVSCTGLTANHKVCNWGLFSDSGYTTPISINDPPADITITEGSGSYSITIANFTSTFYMQPTFILPQN